MPDDNPPISTTVPETVTVDTGASPEDVNQLKPIFKDFWDEVDSGAAKPESEAPEAPGPGQETKEPTSATPKPVAKVEQVVTPEKKQPVTEPSKEYTDDEIDAITLIPGQRPEIYDQFKSVKDKWKADRALLRTEQERHKAIESQLAEARANQLTPELKADYEHAAGIRRRFDFASDPEFVTRFHTPVLNQYQNILDEAASMLPDPQAGAQWAAYVKQNYSPDQLNRDWWLNSVVAKIPNELDRQQVMSGITELFKLQKDRNAEVHNRTNDSASFDNWIKEKADTTAKRVQEEIMSEIGVQETRIREVLPRDVASAKTKEERAAIEEHNSRFQKLNEFFVNTMKDISANGPKAWVRAAIEATRTQIMNEQIVNLEKELKDLKAERDQLRTDLERINGARRRISQTSGTPPTPTGAKPPNGQGLSLKDLDVRKSFRSFDWGDSQ